MQIQNNIEPGVSDLLQKLGKGLLLTIVNNDLVNMGIVVKNGSVSGFGEDCDFGFWESGLQIRQNGRGKDDITKAGKPDDQDFSGNKFRIHLNSSDFRLIAGLEKDLSLQR
jgi:hypothetical protein